MGRTHRNNINSLIPPICQFALLYNSSYSLIIYFQKKEKEDDDKLNTITGKGRITQRLRIQSLK